MERIDVSKVLKQSPPFLFVDNITLLTNEEVICTKFITHNDQYLQGHFANNPIVPGVLLMEMAAQASMFLTYDDSTGKVAEIGYLVKVESFKFQSHGLPGDIIEINVKKAKVLGNYITADVKIYKNSDRVKVARGKLIFYVGN